MSIINTSIAPARRKVMKSGGGGGGNISDYAQLVILYRSTVSCLCQGLEIVMKEE